MSRPKRVLKQVRSALATFFDTEASGGLILFAATLGALVWANLVPGYEGFWSTSVRLGPVEKDLRHWVNDGFMALFFFVVGLEIKRELVVGELREFKKATLPVAGAIGGMLVPAGIYLALNAGGVGSRGWAVPMATDIAFVIGALALLGSRVPDGMKVFLLALAIIDDIGAIVVIAIVYTGGVGVLWLLGALACVGVIVILRMLHRTHPVAYIVPGVGLWYAFLEAGVHPTLAGVALGLLTPARPLDGRDVLSALQHRIHPISSYVAIPVFGLANAGVVVTADIARRALGSPISWGIIAGLVAGKAIGIGGASTLAHRIGIGRRPDDLRTGHIVGAGFLGGIGFTVALFIATLAFEDPRLVDEAKLGILGGSVVAGLLGAAIVVRTTTRSR